MGCFSSKKMNDVIVKPDKNNPCKIRKKESNTEVISINSGIFVNQKNYDLFLIEYESLEILGKGLLFYHL